MEAAHDIVERRAVQSASGATLASVRTSGSATRYGSAVASEVTVSIETQRRKRATRLSTPPTRWSSWALRGATSIVW
jgi:hypothetical protein